MADFAFYEGEGCIECAGTGFRGRTAIHELLELTDNVREMILAKKPSSEIRRAAQAKKACISFASRHLIE